MLNPYREAIDAVSELDVDVIVVTTPAQLELLGELPDRVRVLESAPLHLVLPYCDAIVHQCGDGTALTAAAAGIPQLAITRKPDPALTADRLAAAGVGRHLRYQDLSRDPHGGHRIRAAVHALVSEPAYRAAAERLRAEIEGQPPPSALVPTLEALAARGAA
jgi:glycosyltransferase